MICIDLLTMSSSSDLADMKLISKYNIGILFFISIFSKFAWVFTLKDKKDITNTNVFQNFLDKSGRKPNKIWVNKRSEFYNRSMKS